MHQADHSIDTLIRKLQRLAPIGDEDAQAISRLQHRVVSVPSKAFLVRETETPTECCLLIEGYAARSKLAENGGRQIVSFHVPGDMLDLQHLFLEKADHNVQTITSARVAWIPNDELRGLLINRPAIGTAFWRDALIDASIFREWVLNVGRRDAKTRVAHMLCEFALRCQNAGLGTPERLHVPFTQEEIADATGLTAIHVNRMLRSLTEDGLIKRTGHELEILDWDAFRRTAGFDPAYLHAAA